MAIDGTYKLEMALPTGTESGEVTLKTDGNTLSGVGVGKDGAEMPFDGGTVDGNGFSCTMEASGPTGPMQLDITGIVEGDNISGEMKAAGFAFKFSGSRI